LNCADSFRHGASLSRRAGWVEVVDCYGSKGAIQPILLKEKMQFWADIKNEV